MDALSEADLYRAWLGLRALVFASPPKVRITPIKKNGVTVREAVGQLEEKLKRDRIRSGERGVDLFNSQLNINTAVAQTLEEEIVPLFEVTMQALYTGKYLENYREFTRGRELPY